MDMFTESCTAEETKAFCEGDPITGTYRVKNKSFLSIACNCVCFAKMHNRINKGVSLFLGVPTYNAKF